jgi:hypothetical protein
MIDVLPDENFELARQATERAIAISGIRAASTDPDARRLSSVAFDEDSPRYRSPLYYDMAFSWKICRDLFAGTKAIRGNALEYIPQGGAETPQEYVARVQRTECFPGFQHSIKGLAGIVCRDDPELQDDVPPRIKEDAEDIDGQGTHFAVFAKQLFKDGMITGHNGILVDVPAAPKGRAGETTLREEQDLGLRAYWSLIHAENIYSNRFATIQGKVVLTQLVLHEATEEAIGDFLQLTVVRYRVFKCEPISGTVEWELWEEDNANPSDPPIKIDAGPVTNQIRIPFAANYSGERIGPLHTDPPLLDLAYTNIAHIQVSSDRRHSLHIASVPILVFVGRPLSAQVDGDGNPRTQAVGPNVGLDVPVGGDVKYAEHNGSALSATREELQDLERRMSALGLSLLQQMVRPAESAEAKRIDKSEKDAVVKSPARAWVDCLEMGLAFHANFYREKTGGSVFVNDDYEDITLDSTMITAYSDMVAKDQMDLETMYTILKNRGAVPEDTDIEKVKANIKAAQAETLNQATDLINATGGFNKQPAGPTPPPTP